MPVCVCGGGGVSRARACGLRCNEHVSRFRHAFSLLTQRVDQLDPGSSDQSPSVGIGGGLATALVHMRNKSREEGSCACVRAPVCVCACA
eukprot:9052577-Alexandrium_andersonii.AAC.1